MASFRTSGIPSVRQFHDLAAAFYETTFERFPIQGSLAGRHEFDKELGHNHPKVHESQSKLIEQTLRAVEDLPPQDFLAGDMLDRRTFLANLRLDKLNLVTLRRWENNPQMHLHAAADAVYDLFVRNAEDLAAVAPAILARLKKIPRYLDESAECLRRPDPLWKQLALIAAPGVAELFLNLAQPLADASGSAVAPVSRAARQAADAVEAYARHVSRLRPAPSGSFAIGEERLSLLIHERLGLDLSPREAMAMARRLAERLSEELSAEARRFHPKKQAGEILADAAAQWRPQGNLVDLYEKTTRQMRDRFFEADLLTFPKGDRLLVRQVPRFMQNIFPTAAYSSPGALDTDQTGIFWVNDLGSQTDDAKRQAAEVAQHFGMELTCAHEAYPGHHVQFVIQNRHPSLTRKMAHHAIYYEGWTLWCEQMVADMNLVENPYLRLSQLHDALWRAWRIVIDVGLQTGELSYQQACKVLQREVGFTEARAQGDINWYTSSPSVPMSYLLGKMELLQLKRERVDLGGMNLREFNDWVLSFGAIPWHWIKESGL